MNQCYSLLSWEGSHQPNTNELQDKLQQVSSQNTELCKKVSTLEKTVEEKDKILAKKNQEIQELQNLLEKDENSQSLTE